MLSTWTQAMNVGHTVCMTCGYDFGWTTRFQSLDDCPRCGDSEQMNADYNHLNPFADSRSWPKPEAAARDDPRSRC